MHTLKILAVLLGFTFVLGNGETAELKRDIPKAPWEPIFFETINQVTRKGGLKPLRAAPLPADSLEVRVWIGFGLSPLQLFSLRRDGSKWKGQHLTDIIQKTNSVQLRSVTPKSGWDELWKKLVQLDLLTLPDSSTLRGEETVLDGVSYVVEINREGRYRTYQYGNPEYQKWPEAKKIIKIVEMLYDELAKP